jgi:hypothetical protein
MPGTEPAIATLCGSTRFRTEMAAANRRLTLAGYLVLAPGVFAHDGDEITEQQKAALDALHLRKVDLAELVYVVNPGGYIGESTRREIAYARRHGKRVEALVETGVTRSGTFRGEAPCWMLVPPGGGLDDVDDEGSHYASQAEARDVAAGAARRRGEPPLQAMALPQPCWYAVAACGDQYDGGGEVSCVHFPDAETLAEIVSLDGWQHGPEGVWTCAYETCPTCADLRTQPSDEPPSPIEGQLDLLTGTAFSLAGRQDTPDGHATATNRSNRRNVSVSA